MRSQGLMRGYKKAKWQEFEYHTSFLREERRHTCPKMERKRAGWKMDVIGRTGLSLERGLDLLIVMNDTDINIPSAVICLSPYLTPSKYSTEREYAEMRQFKARIWKKKSGTRHEDKQAQARNLDDACAISSSRAWL